MLDLKLKDKIPCSGIRKRTKIIDIIEYTLKQKWKWAGHIARLKDNRWTKRCTEWQPRRGKRSRGRPSRRWQDITEKEGTTWIRKATDGQRWKTLMEGYILPSSIQITQFASWRHTVALRFFASAVAYKDIWVSIGYVQSLDEMRWTKPR